MIFSNLALVLILIVSLNCEETTPDYEESLLENNDTIVITPKLVYEYELFNENNDTKFLKWLTLYRFDEDNSTMVEINQKSKLHSDIAFTWLYRKTPNRVVFEPEDFKKMYLFFTTQNKTNLRIISSSGREIIINKYNDPFYVSMVEKKGFWKNETIRGLIFDWKELKYLIGRGAGILQDLGL